MKLVFDSIEEVQEFVKKLKGTRGGKDKGDEVETAGSAPAPLQPPAGGAPTTFNPGATTGFAPQGAGAAPAAAAFPAAGAPVLAPEVQALVNRIIVRLDHAVGMGQAADALKFFQGQCGPDAANYTLDQIKAVALPKLAMPALENIAKLMNA